MKLFAHYTNYIRSLGLIALLAAVAITGCASARPSMKPMSLSHAGTPTTSNAAALPTRSSQPPEAPPVSDPSRYEADLVSYQRQQAAGNYQRPSPRDANCNPG
jgi:hypothetical protein